MMRRIWAGLAAGAVVATVGVPAHEQAVRPLAFSPPPLLHAHSHNDYADTGHELTQALDERFNSVEADVWLKDGNVLVGHDENDLNPSRTLQNLYLDKLAERVRDNDGRVYPSGDEPFDLVIELKGEVGTNDVPTSCTDEAQMPYENGRLYQRVHDMLDNQYAGMLSAYDNGVVTEGAVKVVFSGHTPRECVTAHPVRHEFFDGGSGDYGTYSAEENPITTAEWSSVTDLPGFVRDAHEHGRQVRLYDTPQDDDTWYSELEAGVDFLNTDLVDHPTALADFLDGTDQYFGWVATPGAAVSAESGTGLTPASLSGTLFDTEVDGICAHVAVTFFRLDGTAEPTSRHYLCGAYTSLDWSAEGTRPNDDYARVEVDVFRDNGPVVSRDFPT
ncbi:glycerophosphoryl diester phosphodiesterase [Amycolatopsis bartoniae]|uniref:Uncharacterized protein n=1 Tax=Amycolatopsis bartoniae TaxID=941986 RepID=A0A8H9J3Y9_9PSEU|nr:hypothetical protein [Amycolatopsis bartoniae]MBB2934124.1 glycerophosphoryl diester phosphodiesterase [Amycolatopsis bartoniae]TVT05506.1 hypothetical protein FNH07_22780 [Amycolatopsis bartoniae]GHF84184.1 hypothetical protein GCM10017566_67750 [Amycolatopsis bartoniae]